MSAHERARTQVKNIRHVIHPELPLSALFLLLSILDAANTFVQLVISWIRMTMVRGAQWILVAQCMVSS